MSGDGGGKRRGGVSSTVIIALSILGAGLLISLAIFGSIVGPQVIEDYQQQVAAAESQREFDQSRMEKGVQAFISDDADGDDIDAFRNEVETWTEVASIDFVTKDEAYEEYAGSGPADGAIEALGDNNPFPAYFRIHVKTIGDIDRVGDRIRSDALFAKIADMGSVSASLIY